jgi:hypothetical protein
MKLKEAQKKYKYLNCLKLPEKTFLSLANWLEGVKPANDDIHCTPLALACDPIRILVEWDIVCEQNAHKMNPTLLNLERNSRAKFSPRSQSVSWGDRIGGLQSSFNQSDNHIPKYYPLRGEAELSPLSIAEAAEKMKSSTSAGLPFLNKKGKVCIDLLSNLGEYLDRKDPCVLFTRTTEKKKTRDVWGYPFADSLFEMTFYAPLLLLQQKKWYRAAIVSPDLVSERITEMILKAIRTDKWLYSVDFRGFDASVRYQYIIAAFDYIKSCFAPVFGEVLDYICERFYTIGIVTPSAIFRGKHGVPSGSTFTNEVDSIVQLIIALRCEFIKQNELQIQGDDGVYIMDEEERLEFESVFNYAGLKMNDIGEKADFAKNYVMFCQNLYHIDYIGEDGIIGGIYPTYRALCRVCFQERFVNFSKSGIRGSDYYGIRCLSILENCKHHPLFEELVRFVYAREKYHLDVSADGIIKYCTKLHEVSATGNNLRHQYGTDVSGIRDFAAYKIVAQIRAEEDYVAALNSIL